MIAHGTMEPTLRLQGISKSFPGVVANDDISFDVLPGSIHCLLGENGAGKSTLAGIIYGVQRPDLGTIEHSGGRIDLRSPRDAIAAGIGMVHQHFELVTPMSTIENVLIGTSSKRRLDLTDVRSALAELCETYDVDLDLDAPVGGLPVGQQQWVEILKAMYLGVDLLILDEPTAVLTPSGVERLFEALNRMRKRGLAVILISHKMDEVMGISDRVTVLRHGRLVETVETAETSAAELTKLMVGRDVELTATAEIPAPGPPVLEITGMRMGTETGRGALRGIDLVVREGEILGIAGVSGNGQGALYDALVGMVNTDAGTITIGGTDITDATAASVAAMGVGSVPADRIQQGLLMDFTIGENLVLRRHRRAPYARRGILRRKSIARFADEAFESFEIAAPSAAHITRTLSGGNLQKVVMARELAGEPRLLIIAQPTRGLDIGATDYVRRRLLAERDRGAAILLISEDLDEIVSLSTRIAVLHDGEIMGEVANQDFDIETIGRWMTGASSHAMSGTTDGRA
ncbi:ABC transporter ATP-binding protein [Candidatus Poriferisocius sp.]|uniref:ABC transporter ATP-binding protein n=1 Tax=Candidatus Poriferisocius sp. TaxID=3101276 RepID=UPI003B026486